MLYDFFLRGEGSPYRGCPIFVQHDVLYDVKHYHPCGVRIRDPHGVVVAIVADSGSRGARLAAEATATGLPVDRADMRI